MRILLIEDERKLARVIGRTLTKSGYAVDIQHDSDSGLAMAQTECYDLMIFDRMIPGEINDSVEIVKILRKDNINTPVLLLTALSETSDKVDGLDSGADDYLTKPFSIEELLARVRALIRRPVEQNSTIMKIGELKLDSTNRQVFINDKELTLTIREFALLEYLMSVKGRTVSKDQIINHVWNFDSNVLPNTVEVFIKRLRNIISKEEPQKYIKTIRGIGYKIEE